MTTGKSYKIEKRFQATEKSIEIPEKSIQEKNKVKSSEKRVIIFSGTTREKKSGKPISFLFSVKQVEDIIKEIDVKPVPFSPSFVEGISLWRDLAVPVLRLEDCLGLEDGGKDLDLYQRLLLVRTGEGTGESGNERRGLIRVASGLRMYYLPIDCSPAESLQWLPDETLVKAVYDWENGYLVVADLKKILEGSVWRYTER